MKTFYTIAVVLLMSGCVDDPEKKMKLDPKGEEVVTSIDSVADLDTVKKADDLMNYAIDSRPGMKGIYLGMTLDEVSDRVKKVYPGTSHLDLEKSVVLDPDKSVTFSLADSLHTLGEYPIKQLYGQAYNDTIINIRAKFDNEKALMNIPEILLEVYGSPSASDLQNDTQLIYEGESYMMTYFDLLKSGFNTGTIEFIDKKFQGRMNIEREDTMRVKPVDKAVQDF